MRKWLRDPVPEIPQIPEIPPAPADSEAARAVPGIYGISGRADGAKTDLPPSPAPPPTDAPQPQNWSAEDWAAFFNERAAIIEYDGGLSHAVAEARAYGICISQWLLLNPTTSASDRCLQCNGPETVNDPLMPVGLAKPDHLVWLHRTCVPAWRLERLATAADALAGIGLSPGEATE